MPRRTLTLTACLLLALLAGCAQTPTAPTTAPTNRADAALDAMTSAPVPTVSHTRPTAVTPATATTTALTSSTNLGTETTASTSAPTAANTATVATAAPTVLAATPTRTAVPAATAAPAAPEAIGHIEPNPINPVAQDGTAIPAIANKWFRVERWNNTSNPPVHEFLALQGSQLGDYSELRRLGIPTDGFLAGHAYAAKPRVQDNGASPWGERAWLAENQATAYKYAVDGSIGYKAANNGHTVIGPDKVEVR